MADKDSLKLLSHTTLTPYDVLGYVTPGAAVLIAVLGFETGIQITATGLLHVHTPVYTGVVFILSLLRGTEWVLSALLLIAALATVYLVGHVVASISALCIDRMYVERSHGYPFELLLGLPSNAFRNPYTKPFARALFFWANAYIALRYWATVQDVFDHATAATSLVLLVARTVGWAVVALILMKFVVSVPYGRGRTWLAWPLEKTPLGRGSVRVLGGIIKLAAVPYDLIVNPLGGYLHTREPFDESFRNHYEAAFKRLFDMNPTAVGTNNFWFSLIHLKEQSPQLAELAENWLRLYGFARNLGAALYLAFLYCLVWLIAQGQYLGGLPGYNVLVLMTVPPLFFVGALAMLIRYYYLYVDYYSKYVFRCFVYLSRIAKTA